ncbi:MAG: NAD(P)-dependent oxidoreductase [Pirellulales bacterium]|nr:NAD(P)-dependent oxidoreductase [Pirellulales bacterium]
MDRVLVTGANGFVGSNLVEMLQAQGDEVTCLVRRGPQLARLEATGARLVFFEGFSDREAIRRAVGGQTVVYHVAGATKALRPSLLEEVNEQGTRRVGEACAEQADPPVLVYVSSLAACGPSRPGQPRVERDPPQPVSKYGRSKLAGERALRALADRVPTTIVRPAIVFGPADVDGHLMFRSVRTLATHMNVSGRRHQFSLIHVEDLCRLIRLAAQRGKRITVDETDDTRAVGCYFAATEETPTWPEVGRLVADSMGRRHMIILTIPKPLAWLVAGTIEAYSRVTRRPLYLNWDKTREITAGSWTCSPRAANTELGFTPETSLAERFRQTFAWYRAAGWS